MARLLIYDAYENKVYTYANLNENDPMPYSTLTTLRLREFRGKSASPTLWTTIAAMEAWNLTRRMVDVSQDVIIREEDCHVTHGIKVSEISENGQVIENYWWRWVFPSLALGICTISINCVGDGLRDAIDPKSKER